MKRVLPAIVAFALVFVGVAGGLALLTSRDHSSIEPATPATTASSAARVEHLPAGNVVVEFSKPSDGILVDHLAETLGAIDTKATRAAGQALVSKKVDTSGIVARTVDGDLALDNAADPRLAAFVRAHLGRTGP